MGALVVQGAGFLVFDACHVFVRVRDERLVLVWMGSHLLCGGSSSRLVVCRCRDFAVQVELVGYRRIQAGSVQNGSIKVIRTCHLSVGREDADAGA